MPTVKNTLRILEFIRGYISSNGVSPTFAEIQRHFQISSAGSVHKHLVKMEERGWIKRIPNVSRGIRLVEQETKAA